MNEQILNELLRLSEEQATALRKMRAIEQRMVDMRASIQEDIRDGKTIYWSDAYRGCIFENPEELEFCLLIQSVRQFF